MDVAGAHPPGLVDTSRGQDVDPLTRGVVPEPSSIAAEGVEPAVLVVAVTYNSLDIVEPFLRALPAALEGIASARVVIIDNASSDGTLEMVKSLAPWVEARSSGRNAGYAGGINVALRAFTASDGVLVLNPDAVPEPGCVRALADAARDPAVGIAVPRILDVEGKLKFSLRREPTLLRAVGEAVLGGHRAARFPRWGDMIRDPAHYVDGATADWATGAAMYVARPTMDEVGLWDESYFLYSEETDYALRARDAGLALRYVAGASVRHPGGEMSRSPWLWSILTVNRVKLYRSRHRVLASAVYWCVVAVNEALRAAMGRRTHRAALWALLTGSPAPVET